MDVFALFSDKTAEKVLLDSFPSREKETGLVLKTTISSSELKKSATTSINAAYVLLGKLYNNIPEQIGVCVYGFSSSVTGNSADLAFALAFFAYIIKKGIIKPSKPMPLSIAATGVISERLSVERIGHIREKLLAAAQNKIEVVLYPFGNQNEIDELKKTDTEFAALVEKINLIPIKSLEDIFYEFGFLKTCEEGAKRNSAGRKFPVALVIVLAVVASVSVVSFAIFKFAIPKKDYSAALLAETSNKSDSLKTIATPSTIKNLPSPTLSIIVESTPKTEPVKSSGDIAITATPVSAIPVATQKPVQATKAVVEKKIPESMTSSSSSNEKISIASNISANLMNSGFVAANGDWIYYTDQLNVGLYKMKNDGSCVSRLQNALATQINVSENGIYYLDTRSRGLFVIKADGLGKKIHDDDFGMLRILGDWVYYLNKKDNLIYKVHKSGLDRTSLCKEFQTSSGNIGNTGVSCSHMCVENSLVYFYAEFESKPEENGIYSMKTDGSDKKLITRNKCDMLSVEDEYIYFASSDKSGLYRVKANGTGKEKIHDNVKTFNLSSGFIYFSTDEGLFKMNYNGDFISKLSNDSTNKINIVSNWIYYFNANDQYRLYRIKPNGTDKQSIGK